MIIINKEFRLKTCPLQRKNKKSKEINKNVQIKLFVLSKKIDKIVETAAITKYERYKLLDLCRLFDLYTEIKQYI